MNNHERNQRPRLLVLDIETAPAVAYVWRMFKENISNDQLIQPHTILCVGCKWVGEREVKLFSVWEHGEQEMLSEVRNLLLEADGIITYNGKKFDLPHLQSEMIRLRLPPVPPVSHIDLFKFVRDKTRFMSKKLGYVAEHLGIGTKMKHEGFDLWKKVLDGDEKSQARMARYCRRDVVLTERVYQRLKGYITEHPAIGFCTPEQCPTCGSKETQRRGFYYTRMYRYQRHQCTKCGSWFKGSRQKIGNSA